MKLIGLLIDTVHRLASSRKAVVIAFFTVAAGITEAIPMLVLWAQLFGLSPERQQRLETTAHVVAATLLATGNWLAKLFKDEDVALKTALPPPAAPAPPQPPG